VDTPSPLVTALQKTTAETTDAGPCTWLSPLFFLLLLLFFLLLLLLALTEVPLRVTATTV